MRASANVHPVSVRTHRGDNYTDECEKTNNTPEDRHGGLKKLIENCGSWPVLQRRVAWIVRFCQWIANGRVARFNGRLTLEELSQSAQAIARSVQNECFPEDVKEVSQNKEVKISSRLRSLRPVLENRILRVGGRLRKAVVLSWDEKHPMNLPKHHHVSQLIVRHYHKFAAPSGREQTLCELRRKFWIFSGRRLVKNIIRSCIRCRGMNAKPME